ncbi:MAG: hypothetical protein IJX78_01920 [Bacilli bacterium]|nr:hypothetical protein [Bacilli bacterium]
MIKIYLGTISKLIENTNYDDILNKYDEVSIKRLSEKKAGEILLLKALSQENIVINEPLKYIYKGSKPYLESYPYYYNISHTEDFIVLAISTNEVGIDVENKNRLLKNNKLVNSIKEWTIKEAFVKYLALSVKDIKRVKILDDYVCLDDGKGHYQSIEYDDYIISIVNNEEAVIKIIKL